MRSFIDFFALWTAVNATSWWILWWGYDKNITWQDDLELLFRTSVGATAITAAVWGISRIRRDGSAVPQKYAAKVESAFDSALPGTKNDQVSDSVTQVDRKEEL